MTVEGDRTYLNGEEFLVIGVRCSNALISDETAEELIANLDGFSSCGINTVGVYFMGSRFGDVKGYRQDGTLNAVYAKRMGRIIAAADERGMVGLAPPNGKHNCLLTKPKSGSRQATAATAV